MFASGRPSSSSPRLTLPSSFFTYFPSFLVSSTFLLGTAWHVYDRYFSHKELRAAIKKCKDNDMEIREHGVREFFDYVSRGKKKHQEFDYNAECQTAYELGAYGVLQSLIATPSHQTGEILDKTLDSMSKMLLAEPLTYHRKRHQILSSYGIHHLFQLCINPRDDIPVEKALSLLSELTEFDRFRRWTLDDVPNGSQGCKLFLKESTDDLTKFLEHFQVSSRKVLQGAAAVIAHASEYRPTARLLSEIGALRILVGHLDFHQGEVSRNVLLAVSNIFAADPQENLELIQQQSVMAKILRVVPAASPRNDVPDNVISHSAMFILFTLAEQLLQQPDSRINRNKLTEILVREKRHTISLFLMTESNKQSTKRHVLKFIQWINEKNWSDNHMELVRIYHESMSLKNAMTEMKRQHERQRHMQMMQMGGGGLSPEMFGLGG